MFLQYHSAIACLGIYPRERKTYIHTKNSIHNFSWHFFSLIKQNLEIIKMSLIPRNTPQQEKGTNQQDTYNLNGSQGCWAE